ncbi:MAG TPA: TAXI family TRAP transporter solute-binding subunit [Geminicoccaceae bacterium]|nr:TAXI family TRAP transporter solute-binding subunit [Geminicoccus sp.]HMU48233.1 TAXI family TRAP transporter solute-binding subunit [Geminicoccaceae bacterium]
MRARHLGLIACVTAVLAWTAAARAAPPYPTWPDAVVLATASPGGTYDVYGQGLARILTRVLGIQVGTRQTGGPAQNIELLERGEVQLAFVTMGVALQAWNGTEAWTGGRQLRGMRALFPMYDTPFHFVTLRESGIDRIAAMAGKRIGIGPLGGTAASYVPSFLGLLGVAGPQLADGTWADLAQRLEAGGLDVLAVAAGVPFPAVAELEPRRKVAYVPLSADEVIKLRLAHPELTPSVIHPGSYPSLNRPYETVGVYNFAVAREDLPDTLAYRIVETVFAQHEQMMEVHPAAAATVPRNFVHNTFMPFHAGAIRYYANTSPQGMMLAD